MVSFLFFPGSCSWCNKCQHFSCCWFLFVSRSVVSWLSVGLLDPGSKYQISSPTRMLGGLREPPQVGVGLHIKLMFLHNSADLSGDEPGSGDEGVQQRADARRHVRAAQDAGEERLVPPHPDERRPGPDRAGTNHNSFIEQESALTYSTNVYIRIKKPQSVG